MGWVERAKGVGVEATAHCGQLTVTDGWWGLSKRRRGRHAFPPPLFRVLRQCAVEAPQTGRHAEREVITTLSQQGGGKRRGGTDASQLSLEQSGGGGGGEEKSLNVCGQVSGLVVRSGEPDGQGLCWKWWSVKQQQGPQKTQPGMTGTTKK